MSTHTTPESISNGIEDVSEEDFVEHLKTALSILRTQDEAASQLKHFKEVLSAAGIPAGEFVAYVKMRRRGNLEKSVARAGKIKRLAVRFGDLEDNQQSLFSESLSAKSREEVKLIDVAQQGYDAGIEGLTTDGCPYDPGTEFDDTWRRNYAAAREFLRRSGQSTHDEDPPEVRPRRSSLREVA